MSFELFQQIVHGIKGHVNSNRKISEFLEQKICRSSYCYVDIGDELINLLIKVVCQEFGLEQKTSDTDDWFSWWLFENVDKKIYYQDGTIKDVNSEQDFYNFLVSYKDDLKKSCS